MTDTLYCSFCNKSQHDVRKLIVGPMPVHICDECVALCATICVSDSPPGFNAGVGIWYISKTPPSEVKPVEDIIRDTVRVVLNEQNQESSA